MDVILLKNVERLGQAGEKHTVKDGFARNFLLPRGFALPATPANANRIKSLQSARTRAAGLLKERAMESAHRLEKMTCTFPMNVGDQDKLHGVVTAGDIVESLKGQGMPIEKHQVELPAPIAQLGTTRVTIRLHPEVNAAVQVSVIRK